MDKPKIVCLPGDGIGPEVTASMKAVVAAAGADIDWIDMPAGLSAIASHGDPLPQVTIDAITKFGVAIKGPTGTPLGDGHMSVNVRLRQHFDLYVGLRPFCSLPLPKPAGPKLDLLLYRQNTEGFYACTETLSEDGRSVTLSSRFSAEAMELLATHAFNEALRRPRRHVTLVTKSNIFKGWGKLYRDAFMGVAAMFEGEVTTEELLVDAAAAMLVQRPERFDVIVTENLFGDILSDLCAALIGGLGVAPGANIGSSGHAIFEAVHGTADDIAGQDKANPTAMILSAAMMLERFGGPKEVRAAQRIRAAVETVLRDERCVTGDLRKYYPEGAMLWSTSAFADEVCTACQAH